MKSGDFRPYIAFFDPKKWKIENSPCFIQPYNVHFAPKKGDIGPITGDISRVFHFISTSYLGSTPSDIRKPGYPIMPWHYAQSLFPSS